MAETSGGEIIVVFGTRPEAIKMLPVVRALRARGARLKVVVTGQHGSMLTQVFDAFGERPDIDLALMTQNQSLADLTALALLRMRETIETHRPSLVLVHGDTTTAFAAALAAFYARIPIGHVEAGLRSHDVQQPWPEEFNRIAIDSIADLLFAPTDRAAQCLKDECPRPRSIFVTGNTGIDALMHVAASLPDRDRPTRPDTGNRLLLVTGHRRENFGSGLASICDALARIAGRGDVDIVYPAHLNPEVQRIVRERLADHPNVTITPPVDYFEMVALMSEAWLILTDSGGIQEEGPALGKPVLVMRNVTERPEAVDTGVASLVGTDPDRIVAEVSRLLDEPDYYTGRARKVFPFGRGDAADRIADIALDHVRTS